MNAAVKRILTVLVSLLIISYVGYQAYSALYDPIKTIRAGSGTYDDIIKTNGLVLHQEMVINKAQGGVIDYVRENGDEVAKNGEVAYVYQTEQDAANQRKIRSLKEQISQYQQMGSATSAQSIDIDVLNSEMKKSFFALSEAADSSDATDISSAKADMLSLLNKKQLATGKITNFDRQIADLQNKLSTLSQNTNARTGTVYTPEAGYFVSSADGFENAYNYNKALSITSADVKRLLSAEKTPQQGAIGKIITNYQSYIVCSLNSNDAYELQIGDSVTLRFLLSSQPEVNVTVAAINKDLSGVAVVFKCTCMSSSLAVIRRQEMEIVTHSYTGIKVPDGCVRLVKGTRGVFVRVGNLVRFKKIDPSFSGVGYTVSAINTDAKYLQVYDEIIENGDDFYDGEIIK